MTVAVSSFSHLLFVYGTLQRGQNNYPYWLADRSEAIFIGVARSVHRYPFFVNLLPEFPGCSPCVLNLPEASAACKHVEGEVFLVTEKMRAWIDILEDINDGVYVASSIEVTLLDSFSLLPLYLQQLLAGASFHAAPSPAGDVRLRSVIYFRTTQFPSDWHAPQPRSSTMLLRRFSVTFLLEVYGSRFEGCPAHLRSQAESRCLQSCLNALPQNLQPPSTHAGEVEYGAPLFPKPIVLFIIDGVGDSTYPELGRRTPLEVVAGVPPRVCLAARADAQVPADPFILATTDSSLQSQENSFVSTGINCITRCGASGLLDPYTAGMSCGSDIAHLSMFGYPPPQYYRGRGVYEALGAGMHVGDEDLAFKSNFATFSDPGEDGFGDEDMALECVTAPMSTHGNYYITHRCCDRNFTQQGAILCKALSGTTVSHDVCGRPFDYAHEVRLQHIIGHRCGVVITGARAVAMDPDVRAAELVMGRLSDKITGMDCLYDGRLLRRCEPTVSPGDPEYKAALYSSRLVTAVFVKLTELLKQHDVNKARRIHNRRAAETGEPRKNIANAVLLRGAAKKGWMPRFCVRHGLHGVILSPTCIIKGLGFCCGLHSSVCDGCYPPEAVQKILYGEACSLKSAMDGATGDYSSNLSVKVDAALHALRLRCPAVHDNPAYRHSVLKAGKEAGCELSSCSFDNPHYNFVVVHVKGVDEAGHEQSITRKLQMLQHCARAMEELWEALPAGATMAVVADHSTPLAIGDHSCEPVPVSVATKIGSAMGGDDGAVFLDGVRYYSEVLAAEHGGLGRFRGEDLISLLKRANTHYHF